MRRFTTICLKAILTTFVVIGIVACPIFCVTAPSILNAIWEFDGDDDDVI